MKKFKKSKSKPKIAPTGMTSFWTPVKSTKGSVFNDFRNTKYPKRSTKENRLIAKNPYGDSDRDGIPNWFDCKPLNRKKQDAMGNLMHGAQNIGQSIGHNIGTAIQQIQKNPVVQQVERGVVAAGNALGGMTPTPTPRVVPFVGPGFGRSEPVTTNAIKSTPIISVRSAGQSMASPIASISQAIDRLKPNKPDAQSNFGLARPDNRPMMVPASFAPPTSSQVQQRAIATMAQVQKQMQSSPPGMTSSQGLRPSQVFDKNPTPGTQYASPKDRVQIMTELGGPKATDIKSMTIYKDGQQVATVPYKAPKVIYQTDKQGYTNPATMYPVRGKLSADGKTINVYQQTRLNPVQFEKIDTVKINP